LIPKGLLRGQVLTAVEVFLDDLLVHHETMLVHHRLKNIDDRTFLLSIVSYFTHGYRMNLAEYWHKQLVEHPITEVTRAFQNWVAFIASVCSV
jgi:hypothetical protein